MRSFISQQTQLARAYYSGIGKTAVIYPAAFLVAVAFGQLALGLILYARTVLGATGAQIGFLAGIWSLTYMIGCMVIRPLFDRVLPRFLIMSSTICMMLLSLAMVMAGSYAYLLPLYAVFGLVLGLFWPPMMGWLFTGFEGRRLGRVMAYYNLSWCLGSIISPFICGWLSEQDPRYPIFFAAVLFLLVSVFVAGASLVLGGIRSDRDTGAARDAPPDTPDRSCALRYPAWIGLFCSFFGMGFLAAILPLVAMHEWSVGPTMIGLLFTVRSLSNGFGFVLLGRVHVWHFRFMPMLIAQLLVIMVFFALSAVGSAGAAACLLALFGFGAAMSYSISVFHGAAGSINRARRMAIHETVLAGGLVTGSVAGGWLYEWIASSMVFAAISALMTGLVVLQIIVAWRTGCLKRHGMGDCRPTDGSE